MPQLRCDPLRTALARSVRLPTGYISQSWRDAPSWDLAPYALALLSLDKVALALGFAWNDCVTKVPPRQRRGELDSGRLSSCGASRA
jgi:hypothetical protein